MNDNEKHLLKLATALMEGNEKYAEHWLNSPAKSLGGVTPFEYAKTEEGVREVEQLIGRLEHGIFS